MHIQVKCPQGHSLKVYEKLAGSRMQCPKCNEIFIVPEFAAETPEGVFLDVDEPSELRLAEIEPEFKLSSVVQEKTLETVSERSTNSDSKPIASGDTVASISPRKVKKSSPLVRFLMGFAATVGVLTTVLALIWRFGDQLEMGMEQPETVMPLDRENYDESNSRFVASAPSSTVEIKNSTKPDVASSVGASASPKFGTSKSAGVGVTQKIPRNDGMILYKLPSTIWAAAYDAQQGHLALTQDGIGIAIHSIDNLVNGQTAPKTIIQTKSKPQALCFKQFIDKGWFIYCESNYPILSFIDSATGSLAFQLPINDNSIVYLTSSSNPLDPFVYFVPQKANAGSETTTIGRINLRTKKIDRVFMCPFVDFQISPDGSNIYAKKNEPGLSGFSYFYGTWEDIQYMESVTKNTVPIGNQHGGSVRLINDAIAIRSSLLMPGYSGNQTLDMIEVDKTEFEPLAAFDSFPIAIGLTKDGIAIGSSLTGKLRQNLTLPSDLIVPTRADSFDALTSDLRCLQRFGDTVGKFCVECFTDSNRKLAITTIDDQLMVIPCDFPEYQEPHPLLFSWILPSRIDTGTLTEIRLPSAAKNDQIRFSFALERSPFAKALPDEINLPERVDEVIRWIPDPKLIGKQDLIITGTFGQESRSWRWPVEIRPRLQEEKFDFRITGISGSPDTNLALVWGISEIPTKSPEDLEIPRANKASRGVLAIYDVSTQKIVEKTSLPYEIDYASMHSSGIYATSRNAYVYSVSGSKINGRVLRFDRQTLKRLDAVPIDYPIGTTPYRILFQGSNQMAVIYKRTEPLDGARQVQSAEFRFQIPELDILEETEPLSPPLEGLIGDCPVQYGILWDSVLTKPKLMIEPVLFNELVSNHAASVPEGIVRTRLIGPHPTVMTSQNCSPTHTTFLPNSDTVVRATSERLVVINSDMLNNCVELGPNDSVLYEEPRRKPGSNNTHNPPPLTIDDVVQSVETEAVCGSFVYATGHGKLYRVPIDALPRDPKPFSIEATQDHFVVEAGKKIQFRYNAPGASKYRLQIHLNADTASLMQEKSTGPDSPSKCITLESTDGSFEHTFDPEEVTVAILDGLKRSMKSTDRADLTQLLKPMQKFESAYKALTKRNPNTIPAVATFVLVATHQDGNQKAALMHGLLVEIPFQEILRRAPYYFED
ncbi:MAG: hypothetical protein ACK42H_14485 [Planctomycetota bacterium]|jgi:gamma-glutamylcyclotransferase (GGCT)/AIG2-like uncharacterized protein YtfP